MGGECYFSPFLFLNLSPLFLNKFPLIEKTMKRDEVLALLSATQDNNALLNNSGNDMLSETIVNIVDECTDEETDEVNLEGVKDRLKYMELETQKAQRKALEIFEAEEAKEEAKMQDFEIEVVRIGYGYKTIPVRATSQEEAEALALDEAGSYEFSEKDAEYKLINE